MIKVLYKILHILFFFKDIKKQFYLYIYIYKCYFIHFKKKIFKFFLSKKKNKFINLKIDQ